MTTQIINFAHGIHHLGGAEIETRHQLDSNDELFVKLGHHISMEGPTVAFVVIVVDVFIQWLAIDRDAHVNRVHCRHGDGLLKNLLMRGPFSGCRFNLEPSDYLLPQSGLKNETYIY